MFVSQLLHKVFSLHAINAIFLVAYLNTRYSFFGLHHPRGFRWLPLAHQLR